MPVKAARRLQPQLRKPLPHLRAIGLNLLPRDLGLPHRKRDIRRPDEDAQTALLTYLMRRLLRNLHARRAIAYHSHVFPTHVHFRRPERGVVDFALEGVDARPVGDVPFRCEADAGDEEARDEGKGGAVGAAAGHAPFVCAGGEGGGCDARVEVHVPFEVELGFYVREVALELCHALCVPVSVVVALGGETGFLLAIRTGYCSSHDHVSYTSGIFKAYTGY